MLRTIIASNVAEAIKRANSFGITKDNFIQIAEIKGSIFLIFEEK